MKQDRLDEKYALARQLIEVYGRWGVLDRSLVLKNGSMPCDGRWPADRVALFERWLSDGSAP
jgi:hypothetical protein